MTIMVITSTKMKTEKATYLVIILSKKMMEKIASKARSKTVLKKT